MKLGPQNHNGDGLLGPNSIIVVYTDPQGTWILLVFAALLLLKVPHLQLVGCLPLGADLSTVGLSHVPKETEHLRERCSRQ